MADLTLPIPLSISDVKRNSMAALRRTVIHGDTSQNAYGAGEIVYLPLTTGTAGAFWDVSTARLEMTVEVYNPNYFVDFFNLPRCGFHAIIQECGLEIHNSLHENQRFYGEMIELEMMRRGENSVPYEMTVSNPHEVGGGLAGDLHINLIKPSMVTTAGLPHGVRYGMMNTPIGATNNSSVADIITQGLLFNGNPYLKAPFGRNGYGRLHSQKDYYGNETGGYVGRYPVADSVFRQFAWWAETNLPCSSVYDDRITLPQGGLYSVIRNLDNVADLIANPLARQPIIHTYGTPVGERRRYIEPDGFVDLFGDRGGNGHGDGIVTKGGSSFGDDLYPTLPNRFYGTCSHSRQYAKCVPRLEDFGAMRADNNMWTVDYGQTVGGYTPMMWPAKQPCPMDKLQVKLKAACRGVNTKNVQNYYANCKNISCAIPVSLKDDIYGRHLWGGNGVESTLPLKSHVRGERYSFRVSMKFYSCLLGVFAKRWFPSLLVGSGRARIRMVLQQPNILFQTLMDPCRVVPRTARDRFPYLGVFKTGVDDVHMKQLGSLEEAPLGCLAHGIHPILISSYIAGSCFNDLLALGKFPVPQMKMKTIGRPTDIQCKLSGGEGIAAYAKTPHHNSANGSRFHSGNHYSIQGVSHVSAMVDSTLIQNNASFATPEIVAKSRLFSHHKHLDLNGNHAGDVDDDHDRSLRDATIHGVVGRLFQNLYTELADNLQFGYAPQWLRGTGVNDFYFEGPDRQRKKYEVSTNVFDASETDRAHANLVNNVPIGSITDYHWMSNLTPLFVPDNDNAYSFGKNSAQVVYKFKPGGDEMGPHLPIPGEDIDVRTGAQLDYETKGLNWDPFHMPVPQYVPMRRPWAKQTTRTFKESDFLDESQMCYGTYLPRSVAQVRRTNRQLFTLGEDFSYYPGASERLTYSVRNVAFRCEEIILPEVASMQIVSAAMEGAVTLEAETIKSVEQILQKQDNQKIMLNVSAGIVNDICFVFQPTEMYTGDKAYGYNSFAFYCPWTSFRFMLDQTPINDTNRADGNAANGRIPAAREEDYNVLGGNPLFYNALTYGENIGINTYLTISTEFFPRIPINDLHTLIDTVCWGDQHSGSIEYLGLQPMIQNAFDSDNFQRVLPFQDGFFSVFTPIETLDDQTITCNPFWTPLEMNVEHLIRGRRAAQPALPFFKPFEGTFHLAFNLQPFMHEHNTMNVGSPMVNTNAYLHMQQCHMLREHETRMLTFIRVFARIVMERGGIIQIFT